MMKKFTPKGMRDFLPDEMIVREQVIEKIKNVFRNYGFRPLGTPALEYIDILKAKSGDEIAGQIFKIENDEIGLRFDVTVPLARVGANFAFPKPFKRYAIAPVWRREEPQKARMREFWQADADIIGCKSMRAECELIELSNDALSELGFEKPVFILNNRKILDAVAKKLDFEKQKAQIFRFFDKIDKIGLEKVRENIEKTIGENKTDLIFQILSSKSNNKEKIEIAKKLNEEAGKELEEIINNTNANIEINFFLVRGLDYYTGPVFEIKLSKEIGSVGGGGRYDTLLELYGQGDYATGISLGIERLMYLIREKKQKTSRKTYTQLFVASIPGYFKQSKSIVDKCRQKGIPAEIDLNERSLKKQFDYANSLGIEYIVIVGERESKQNKIILREMKSGNEELLTFEDLIKKLKKRRIDEKNN